MVATGADELDVTAEERAALACSMTDSSPDEPQALSETTAAIRTQNRIDLNFLSSQSHPVLLTQLSTETPAHTWIHSAYPFCEPST